MDVDRDARECSLAVRRKGKQFPDDGEGGREEETPAFWSYIPDICANQRWGKLGYPRLVCFIRAFHSDVLRCACSVFGKGSGTWNLPRGLV